MKPYSRNHVYVKIKIPCYSKNTEMNCKIIRLMYSFSGVAYGAYRDMMQSVLHQASLRLPPVSFSNLECPIQLYFGALLLLVMEDMKSWISGG